MRVLHIGPFRLGRPSGHFNALWALACAQAEAGHEVAIVRVGKPVAPEHVEIGRRAGVRLLGFPCPRWRGLWADDSGRLAEIVDEVRPDLAHLFYVRVPKFFYVAGLLQRRGVPYVVSLHGGMNSTEMLRRRTLQAGAAGAEHVTRRNVTFSPRNGTRVITARRHAPAAQSAGSPGASARYVTYSAG